MNERTGPLAQPVRAAVGDRMRLLLAAVVFVVIAVLARSRFEEAAAWLEGLGALAPLVFVGVYLALVTCGFPVAVLGWLAGAMFGFFAASALLVVSALVTAGAIFWLARKVIARPVRRATSARPRLARFLSLMDQDALRIMVLLRLSPLHFGLVCYLGGAGRIRFMPYLAATLCVIPSACLQAYVGHAARRLGDDLAAGPGSAALLATGIAASLYLSWLLGRMAQRALTEDKTAGARRERA